MALLCNITKAQMKNKWYKKYGIGLKKAGVKRECGWVRSSSRRSDEVTKCSAPILGEQQPERRHTFNNIIIIRQTHTQRKPCLLGHCRCRNSDSAPPFAHIRAKGTLWHIFFAVNEKIIKNPASLTFRMDILTMTIVKQDS